MVWNWILQYRWWVYILFQALEFFPCFLWQMFIWRLLCNSIMLASETWGRLQNGTNNGLEMMVNQVIVACRNGNSYTTSIYVVTFMFGYVLQLLRSKITKILPSWHPDNEQSSYSGFIQYEAVIQITALRSSIATSYFTVNGNFYLWFVWFGLYCGLLCCGPV
jgi:hypothetical protein